MYSFALVMTSPGLTTVLREGPSPTSWSYPSTSIESGSGSAYRCEVFDVEGWSTKKERAETGGRWVIANMVERGCVMPKNIVAGVQRKLARSSTIAQS